MKRTHKYGIEIPRDVAHAKELDCINSNTFWMDALKKEMYNVGVYSTLMTMEVTFWLSNCHLVKRENSLPGICCITSTEVDVSLQLFVAFASVSSGVFCALCVQCLSHTCVLVCVFSLIIMWM